MATDNIVKYDSANPDEPGIIVNDDTTLDIASNIIKVKDLGIGTTQLAADSVNATKLNADTAGLGLGQAAGGELDVNVDDSSIEIATDTLQVKADGIDETHIQLANNAYLQMLNFAAASTDVMKLNASDRIEFASLPQNASVPGVDADLANKKYVDDSATAAAAGLDPKESVRCATDAILSGTMTADDIAPTTGNRSYDTTAKTITYFATQGPTAIDGVTLANGDRILIKDESATSGPAAGEGRIYNGIYVRTSLDVFTRADDHDGSPINEVSGGNFCFTEQGTVNENAGFVLQGDGVLTLQTDNIDFVQFSGAGSVVAGDGLDKSGNTLSLDLKASAGLKIDTTELAIEPADFAGIGLEDDGADNLRVLANITEALTTEASAVLVAAAGLSIAVDDSTLEGSLAGVAGAEVLRVKDAGITVSKMAINSVDSDQYVDGSIDTAHYAASSVDTTALGPDSVTSAKIGDDQVDSEHLAAASIDDEHLSDGVATGLSGNGLTDTTGIMAVLANITEALTTEASAVRVAAGGVSIAVDDSTLEGSLAGVAGAEVLQVKDAGITEAKLDAALAAKINAAGDASISAPADGALADGAIVFLDEADGDRATLANATAAATCEGKLYYVDGAVALRDDAASLLAIGVQTVTNLQAAQVFDTTKPFYLSISEAGTLTHVAPTASGNVVFLLGYASDTASEWTFNQRRIVTLP